MVTEIGNDIALDARFLDRARRPLDLRLELTGADLFARDATSRKRFAPLSTQIVGTTHLQEYFGKDQRKSVADWTRTVKERVKKALLDPATRDRIPLPQA